MQTHDRTRAGTVLLAEDDVLVRMPLGEFLRGCGYRVLEANSAEDAIRLVEDDTFVVDVVVSSVELAGDGFGLANWLKHNRPDMRLLLVGSSKRAAETAASLCEDGPLPAPFDPQILHRRILRLLARRNADQREGRRATM